MLLFCSHSLHVWLAFSPLLIKSQLCEMGQNLVSLPPLHIHILYTFLITSIFKCRFFLLWHAKTKHTTVIWTPTKWKCFRFLLPLVCVFSLRFCHRQAAKKQLAIEHKKEKKLWKTIWNILWKSTPHHVQLLHKLQNFNYFSCEARNCDGLMGWSKSLSLSSFHHINTFSFL